MEKEQEKDPSQTARKARGVKCLPERILPKEPEKIIKMAIDPTMGLMDWQARKIALQLFSEPSQVRQAAAILVKLYQLYVDTDCSLAEINPLVLTPDKKVMALDGKMNFDDNSKNIQSLK